MYVCLCKGVTDGQIRREVEDGVRTLRELRARLGVGTQCGSCGTEARRVLGEALCANQQNKSEPSGLIARRAATEGL